MYCSLIVTRRMQLPIPREAGEKSAALVSEVTYVTSVTARTSDRVRVRIERMVQKEGKHTARPRLSPRVGQCPTDNGLPARAICANHPEHDSSASQN